MRFFPISYTFFIFIILIPKIYLIFQIFIEHLLCVMFCPYMGDTIVNMLHKVLDDMKAIS